MLRKRGGVYRLMTTCETYWGLKTVKAWRYIFDSVKVFVALNACMPKTMNLSVILFNTKCHFVAISTELTFMPVIQWFFFLQDFFMDIIQWMFRFF